MAFSNPVVGGENGELIRQSIQSPDYVTGVSGWTINRDGSAEFNNVTIRFELGTGSILVGDPSNPQVAIGSTSIHAFIQFPTNGSFETSPAQIYADVGTITDTVLLHIDSGTTEAGFGDSAQITLTSAEDGVSNDEKIDLRVALAHVQLHNGLILLDSNAVESTTEVLIGTSDPDANFPSRIAGGIRGTGTTDTTLGNGVDTLVTNAAATNGYLVNGVAYRVDVQIIQRSSVGTSAAGTQQTSWKLWDGAVGGTQLGQTVFKMNDNVGSVNSPYQFSFLFTFTGTTGSRTLNLSGSRSLGADTLQARVNSQYFMLINRVGDPALITNL